jgi:hypothetical protein
LVHCGSVNRDVPAVRGLVLTAVQMGGDRTGLASTTTAAWVAQEMRKPNPSAAGPKLGSLLC